MPKGILCFHGQSNMEGYRSDPGLLPFSCLDENIKFSSNRSFFELVPGEYINLQPCLVADGGGNGWTENVTIPDGYSSYGYGCEITCSRALYSDERKVATIKVAQGATSLYDNWNPQPQGNLNEEMEEYINAFIATLDAEEENPYFLGAVFWQGEADVGRTQEEYEYNLERFIKFFRAFVGRPYLPFIICKTRITGADDVRAAQEAVAKRLPCVKTYDPLGLPLYTDNTHYWEDAHVTSGEDIASLFNEFGI